MTTFTVQGSSVISVYPIQHLTIEHPPLVGHLTEIDLLRISDSAVLRLLVGLRVIDEEDKAVAPRGERQVEGKDPAGLGTKFLHIKFTSGFGHTCDILFVVEDRPDQLVLVVDIEHHVINTSLV